MVDSHPGHLTELAQRHAVWENNPAHEHAPTLNLLMVEKTAKMNWSKQENAKSEAALVIFVGFSLLT